jgi:hypothetical protein
MTPQPFQGITDPGDQLQPIDQADRSDPANPADRSDGGRQNKMAAEPDPADLIEQLRQDRLWLLRQIDSGLWAEWRLDLAALERELGQLLDQASERMVGS